MNLHCRKKFGGFTMFLFLAINFDNTARGELYGIVERLAGQSVSGNFTEKDNFHLTLVFIGETDERRIPIITGVMDTVTARPFTLELGGLGKFDREGGDIFWYGVQLCPPLKELNTFISENLRQRGFDVENRKYTPHITLGRKVVTGPGFSKADLERTLPRITVPVSRISLMKSERVHGTINYVEVYGKELQ